MKLPSRATLALSAFTVLAVVFVGLAIIGATRMYTPIPLSDMWDGNIDFFRKVTDGDWSAWWAPHNEHRVVLARILFWIDLAVFRGNAIFLIVVNYALAATALWVIWRFLAHSLPDVTHTRFRQCIALFLTAWLFFWSQEGNLTWGFQSQFILAQLLPLAAFLAMYRASVAGRHNYAAFAGACLLGIASLGTMANGVLALPLLTVYAVLLRMGFRRIVLLAFLSVSLGMAYRHGFAPSGDTSAFEVLRDNPLGYLRFLLLYLGSPFYYIARNIDFADARNIAAAFGALLIVGALAATAYEFRQRRVRALPVALLGFVLYIGGTGAGTTLGRAAAGEIQALASRYTTPALLAWAALILLFAPSVAKARPKIRATFLGLLVVVLVAALPEQMRAIDSHEEEHFQQSVAVIALDMGIHDERQIQTVYPSPGRALQLAAMAADRRLSVFQRSPFVEARTTLGESLTSLPVATCPGSIDETADIRGDSRFVLLRGWIKPAEASHRLRPILFVDGTTVVGYAITGQERSDVADVLGGSARYTGFAGYLRQASAHHELSIVAPGFSCRFVSRPPLIPFRVRPLAPSSALATVKVADVQGANAWQGADFDRSAFSGMHVYGSLVHSNADTGSISLRVHRGATLFYRSGPAAGRQRIQIDGGKVAAGILPLTTEWVQLRFDDAGLPDEFTVTLVDDGPGWGEWSAIAVSDGN